MIVARLGATLSFHTMTAASSLQLFCVHLLLNEQLVFRNLVEHIFVSLIYFMKIVHELQIAIL